MIYSVLQVEILGSGQFFTNKSCPRESYIKYLRSLSTFAFIDDPSKTTLSASNWPIYSLGGFCSSLKCPRPAGKQLEWVSASIVNIKSAFSHQKIGNLSIFLVIWMYFMVLFDMPRFQSSSIFFTVYWVFTHCDKYLSICQSHWGGNVTGGPKHPWGPKCPLYQYQMW